MTNKKEPDYAEIWSTLSEVDVSEYVEEKMNLSYLSWSRAWYLLQSTYPQATYSFSNLVKNEDDTYEVGCTISIGECSRMAILPVMDYKMKAVINPDTRQTNDARMRCFVKAIAMFGLGIKLYMGISDDLPDEKKDKASVKKEPVKKKAEVVDITPDVVADIPDTEVSSEDKYSEKWGELFVEGQSALIRQLETISQLREFYKINMERIAILGERYPDKRDELDAIFKSRSKELEEK